MAFPEIITDRPVGTQMVSTIDDFERETRSWLKQCMQSISGYPDLETITVLGWDNDTRPTLNPSSNYLVGYNTETKALEVIDSEGQVQDIQRSILLAAHPVGEYYWTSNENFDPNVSWGGTWERIRDGRVFISDTDARPLGTTGGVETVTLTPQQMPAHEHYHSHPHNHDRGDMNISGWFGLDDNGAQYHGGAFHDIEWGYASGSQKTEEGPIVRFDAAYAWTGRTSVDATGAGGWQGGGQAHENMQPYRTAICWHRTA